MRRLWLIACLALGSAALSPSSLQTSFGAVTIDDTSTDNYDCGSAADLDNLAEGTIYWSWKPSSVAASAPGLTVFSKNGALDDGWNVFRRAADGAQLQFTVFRATTPQRVRTTAAGLSVGVNYFHAATWNIASGGPKFYQGTYVSGAVGTVAADVSTSAQDGTGTKNDDSANAALWAQGPALTDAAGMDLYFGGICPRALSITEVQQVQATPLYPLTGCLALWNFNSTSSVTDQTGKGHTCTGSNLAAGTAMTLVMPAAAILNPVGRGGFDSSRR